MEVRLTHIDGKLPNLALMKLAHWHKEQGDNVTLARTPSPDMFEPQYDKVYGSAVFQWSSKRVVKDLLNAFPDAVVGGTGTNETHTVEGLLEVDEYEHYDYSIYPEYEWSIGFSQRGCRLNCGFCVVPKKEGRPRSVNSIWDIWRPGTERNICLLDNDFFGQPKDQWEARIEEIKEGNFKVNFNQGINVRLINDESAKVLSEVEYYDARFKNKRLYTAWDNVGQEDIFFKGFNQLTNAGINPNHIMVYMLIGYKPGETMEEILYRYQKLKDAGCLPYPMVYNNENKRLKRFQRWVVTRIDAHATWEEFEASYKSQYDY
tara:strand:- start:41 stop:994 length:954 start_codon:yes stop_codon:yes gene_type:complete